MLVSVIITTKNEERNIENCLKSVKAQDFSENQREIIIVDNESTDRTKQIAQNFTKYVFDHGPERSAQRNFGIRKSSGKYVLYLDADMVLDPGLIGECTDIMENNPSLSGLYIPEKILGRGYWGKVRSFERGFYDGTVVDAVRFFRKDAFIKAGGFDENLTGPEDWDFDKRIRQIGKVSLSKTPLFHNEKDFNLKRYLDRKKYYALDFEKYKEKWEKNDPDIQKQFGFWYRFIGIFTENGKWKKLLRHPILTLGMYFLRFLVGVKYLMR